MRLRGVTSSRNSYNTRPLSWYAAMYYTVLCTRYVLCYAACTVCYAACTVCYVACTVCYAACTACYAAIVVVRRSPLAP